LGEFDRMEEKRTFFWFFIPLVILL
jgi:hypothetical protein